MEISRTAMGVLAAVCVSAGAGAAYLALRGPEAAASGPGVTLNAPGVTAGEGLPGEESAGAPIDASATAPSPQPATQPRATAGVRRSPGATRTVPAPAPSAANAPSAPAASVAERESSEPIIEDVALESVEPALPDSGLGQTARAEVPDEPPARSDEPRFEEYVIGADSVIGVQLDSTVSTETAEVEDRVVAHVTRDLRVGPRVVVPAGSRVRGEVTFVERGGRIRERARLAIRFSQIELADGSRIALDTDPIYREGGGQGRESAAKIGGGAIGGAIIGGLLGGAKGAVIGGTAGAGAGTAAAMAGQRSAVAITAGTPLTIRVLSPVTVTLEP